MAIMRGEGGVEGGTAHFLTPRPAQTDSTDVNAALLSLDRCSPICLRRGDAYGDQGA